MPKISINILTKNRSVFLREALDSVARQSFSDYEVIVVNDASTDDTAAVLEEYGKKLALSVITHLDSRGIITGRQEALANSRGDYVALLDDDDEWIDTDKLKKQFEWFQNNPGGVLVGSAVKYVTGPIKFKIVTRAATDRLIRKTMLLRNNFFTSTVMFKKDAAITAGGFVANGADVAEDYDLWLRLGKLGQMANFTGVFTAYRAPVYTKDRLKTFLKKQISLIGRHKGDYPHYWVAAAILKIRILLT